jgi:hypothetical protein
VTEAGEVVIPRKAMTLIMLREQGATGFEVFLLKRHEQNIFMGGNFVYPGERLDKGDADEEILALSRGVSEDQARNILGETHVESVSLAYWIAIYCMSYFVHRISEKQRFPCDMGTTIYSLFLHEMWLFRHHETY